jgi:hypothetical protein
MFNKTRFFVAALLCAALQPASAIVLKVNAYTGHSVTFTLTGQMPATNPGTLADGPAEIDLNYEGNLWSGGKYVAANTVSGSPITGSGNLAIGNTGGFSNTPTNYSWMYFANDLTGLEGSGNQVTLSWDGVDVLNTNGTGSFDLYWGNLSGGPDATGVRNILLSTVKVVDGRIVDDANGDVPEPGTLALMGISAIALAARRRRK